MGLTTAYSGKLPDDEIVALLEKVYDQGVTFWDTANIYAYFDPSRLLKFSSPVACQELIITKAIKKLDATSFRSPPRLASTSRFSLLSSSPLTVHPPSFASNAKHL
jgi:hypothetical protein